MPAPERARRRGAAASFVAALLFVALAAPASAAQNRANVTESNATGPHVPAAAGLPVLEGVGAEQASLAIERARGKRLSDEKAWLRLGHWREGTFGRYSEADGVGFFFSDDGTRDPQAELEATIRAFHAPAEVFAAEDPQHPLCRFPARLRFLLRAGVLEPGALPRPKCARLVSWLSLVAGDSATLVFAGPYLNNPSSMYGHTLLRIDRRGSSAGSELLGYVLNYAAIPWTENGLLYVVLGLTGGFDGRFTIIPYYMKTQEYANLEHRDLWEYRLALTPAEVETILLHAWELGNTSFDYFFLDENCSYHLLSLLEVARPELDLTSGFVTHVIPSDTIRVVKAQPGLVASRHFRPSHARVMGVRREALSEEEQALAMSLSRGPDAATWRAVGALPSPRQAAVLDAAYDHFTYERGFSVPAEDEDPAAVAAEEQQKRARERELLVARGKLKLRGEAPVVPEDEPPEEGHGTFSIGAGGGVMDGGPFTELMLRPALHDPLSPQHGYLRDTELEMFSARLRFDPRWLAGDATADLPWISRIDFVRIVSASPMEGWIRKPSWRVAFGLRAPPDGACRSVTCLEAGVEGGPGIALASGLLGREVWYGFFDAMLAAGPDLRPHYRIGLGPALGMTAGGDVLRLQLEAGTRWDVLGDERSGLGAPRLRGGLSYLLTQSADLRLSARLDDDHPEAALTLVVYP